MKRRLKVGEERVTETILYVAHKCQLYESHGHILYNLHTVIGIGRAESEQNGCLAT